MAADAFVEKAKTWDADPERSRMAAEFAAEVARLARLTPQTVALDFGCGTGLVGLQFAGLVKELYLLDTSEAMLSVLKEKVDASLSDTVHIVAGPLGDAVVGPATLDVIFTARALHHVKDLPELFGRMNRALKPGGQLIIGDLLAEGRQFPRRGGRPPTRGLSPERLADVLAGCGFSVVRHYEDGVINKVGKDGVRRTVRHVRAGGAEGLAPSESAAKGSADGEGGRPPLRTAAPRPQASFSPPRSSLCSAAEAGRGARAASRRRCAA